MSVPGALIIPSTEGLYDENEFQSVVSSGPSVFGINFLALIICLCQCWPFYSYFVKATLPEISIASNLFVWKVAKAIMCSIPSRHFKWCCIATNNPFLSNQGAFSALFSNRYISKGELY